MSMILNDAVSCSVRCVQRLSCINGLIALFLLIIFTIKYLLIFVVLQES